MPELIETNKSKFQCSNYQCQILKIEIWSSILEKLVRFSCICIIFKQLFSLFKVVCIYSTKFGKFKKHKENKTDSHAITVNFWLCNL